MDRTRSHGRWTSTIGTFRSIRYSTSETKGLVGLVRLVGQLREMSWGDSPFRLPYQPDLPYPAYQPYFSPHFSFSRSTSK